ncbi:MAG: hypothetical protein MJ252_20600, partial [archaeon]|nr:hypothetical protein [archaeon]
YLGEDLSKNNINIKNERYCFKLLKNAIRMTFFQGIILVSILMILGNEFLSKIFSEKWANMNTYKYMFLFGIYTSIKIINSKFASYGSAIFPRSISDLISGFDYGNIFLMLAFSFGLTQIDISGLVIAKTTYVSIALIINWYFSVKNEYLEKPFCGIVSEMMNFCKESLVRNASIVSVALTFLVYFTLQEISIFQRDGSLDLAILVAQDFILIVNCILIFFFEKEDFLDILRVKVYS